MDKKSMEFTVFMIHVLSEAWKCSYGDAYRKLNEAKAIDDYMVPCYDVLHTLGEQYLTDDLTGYLEMRGVRV